MRIGDVVQSSVWITGEETPDIRKQYELDATQAISDLCYSQGYEHGPVTFVEKLPSDSEVPEVPDHISGPRVRLLIVEAEVVDKAVINSRGSFVANLEKVDLERLRKITRTQWAKMHPLDALSDEQCDDYIEELGPEAALDVLRKSVGTSVH
jgi:hypothetical protein